MYRCNNCALAVLLCVAIAFFGGCRGNAQKIVAHAAAGDCGKSGKTPAKVIFDTDMYTDFDDAGALACLHALADVGECEILATLANTRDCMSVAMCEIINAYYGRPDIPVGCSKDIGKTGTDEYHVKRYGAVVEKYAKWVRHRDSDDAPDANLVYRRVLASQPDNSVVICSVGFLTNLRRLLETKPDDISPLDGKSLVARKVKLWVAMACRYPNGKEYNSMMDAQSSRIALENWPTPIVFTDWNYGFGCHAGRGVAESGRTDSPIADVFAGNLPSRNEVRAMASRNQCGALGINGRAAWDQTAVLIAVRGTRPYFGEMRGTYRITGADGANEWVADERSAHFRVTEKMPKAEVGRLLDELMLRLPASRR